MPSARAVTDQVGEGGRRAGLRRPGRQRRWQSNQPRTRAVTRLQVLETACPQAGLNVASYQTASI